MPIVLCIQINRQDLGCTETRDIPQVCAAKGGTTSGWDVPDAKSPEPSARLLVIGISPNFSALLEGEVLIEMSKKRVSSLIAQIDEMLQKHSCSAGEASTLWGRLGHASTHVGSVWTC